MVIKLRIDSRISFRYAELKASKPNCFQAIKKKFRRINPEYTSKTNMGFSTEGIEHKLKSYNFRSGRMYLARGCKIDLIKILKKYKVEYDLIDRRLKFPKQKYPNVMLCAPRDAQPKFIELVKKYEEGLIDAYASFGKTLTILMLAHDLGIPLLVLVHRKLLQEQWIAEATDPTKFNLDKKHIGGVGGVFSKAKVGLINVCLYQSLSKPENLKLFGNAASLFVFDEVQYAPIDACTKIIAHIPAQYRIGMSADHRRKDKKHFVTKWYLGKLIKRFEEKESASKIMAKISVVETDYTDKEYDWDSRAPEMETRSTKDKMRNRLIIQRCKRKLDMGKQVLLATSRKYHVCRLAKHFTEKGYRVGIILGTINKQKDIPDFAVDAVTKIMLEHKSAGDYQRVKKLAEDKEVDIVICTHHKAGVGMSITTLDHLQCCSMITGNLELLNQLLGRVERKYSKSQEKDFGHEKAIPTAEFLLDSKIGRKSKHWFALKNKYGKRISKVQPKRR